MNPSLTAEAARQLHEGINIMLNRWWALNMAIMNKEYGGHDISQQLGLQLFNLLSQSKEQDEIEKMLDAFMDSTLNTDVEDGSVEEIALKMIIMREECLQGNFDSIKKLKETKAPTVSYTRQPGSSDDEDDSDDGDDEDESMGEDDNSSGMEVDAPQPQSNLNQKGTRSNKPEVVDGWTVVPSRRI